METMPAFGRCVHTLSKKGFLMRHMDTVFKFAACCLAALLVFGLAARTAEAQKIDMKSLFFKYKAKAITSPKDTAPAEQPPADVAPLPEFTLPAQTDPTLFVKDVCDQLYGVRVASAEQATEVAGLAVKTFFSSTLAEPGTAAEWIAMDLMAVAGLEGFSVSFGESTYVLEGETADMAWVHVATMTTYQFEGEDPFEEMLEDVVRVKMVGGQWMMDTYFGQDYGDVPGGAPAASDAEDPWKVINNACRSESSPEDYPLCDCAADRLTAELAPADLEIFVNALKADPDPDNIELSPEGMQQVEAIIGSCEKSTEAQSQDLPLEGDDATIIANACKSSVSESEYPMCDCAAKFFLTEFNADELALFVDALKTDPNLKDGVPGMPKERLDEAGGRMAQSCMQ